MSYSMIDDWCNFEECGELIKRVVVSDENLEQFKAPDIQPDDIVLACLEGHFNQIYKCKHNLKLQLKTSESKKNPRRQYYCCSQGKRNEKGDFVGGCENLKQNPDPEIQEENGYPKFHPGYWFWRDEIEDMAEPTYMKLEYCRPENNDSSSATTFGKYGPDDDSLSDITNSTFANLRIKPKPTTIKTESVDLEISKTKILQEEIEKLREELAKKSTLLLEKDEKIIQLREENETLNIYIENVLESLRIRK